MCTFNDHTWIDLSNEELNKKPPAREKKIYIQNKVAKETKLHNLLIDPYSSNIRVHLVLFFKWWFYICFVIKKWLVFGEYNAVKSETAIYHSLLLLTESRKWIPSTSIKWKMESKKSPTKHVFHFIVLAEQKMIGHKEYQTAPKIS